jgi:hypothetical protein
MTKLARVLVTSLVLGGICIGVATANEGMWPLRDLGQLPFDSLEAEGLQLTQQQIYNPNGPSISNAIVGVGGASGSFVSAEGLVITNHHVAFSAVQRQSTPEHNYIRDGFYAPTRDKELQATGYTFYLVRGVEDVTDRVLASVSDDMSGFERYQAIEDASTEIVMEAERDRDVWCEVVPFYGGMQYWLYTYFLIKDVRLVFAPPESIGSYGGDIDNWEWPRHAGDFAFLRAYVGPDGSSAEYDPANVPYNSTEFLKIAGEGAQDGEFVFLIGFPGTTDRYETSFEIKQMLDENLPRSMKLQRDVIDILEKAASEDSAVAVRVASRISGIANYLKKYQGTLDGFKHAHLLLHKQAEEDSLMAFLRQNPELDAKYGWVLSSVDSVHRSERSFYDEERLMAWMGWRVEYLNLARTVYKWVQEQQKPNIDREPGYQQRDSTRVLRKLRDAQVNLVGSVDAKLLKYFIRQALQLPANQRITAIDDIFQSGTSADSTKQLNAFVDSLFAGTKIGSLEERVKMFHMTPTALSDLKDPFIQFAAELQPQQDSLRDRMEAVDGRLSYLTPKVVQAYKAWKDGRMYPDANGTIRFTYGEVKGYSPRDAVYYEWVTTLAGVMQKNTGEPPFNVPAALEKVYDEMDFGQYYDPAIDDVPVDFLGTCDITNGNSGSATMNGRGELIGLAFDGNYESIPSDYVYEAAVNRSITVDITYVLFLLDKVYHADALMNELTIVREPGN